MSRFFKSAAFPILIVVVLAFFAQKLISPGDRQKDPNYSDFISQVEDGRVESVTLNTKNNRVDVELKNAAQVPDRVPERHRAEPGQHAPGQRRRGHGQAEGGSGWLTALTYILPFVIFLLFWLFIINQMQEAGRRSCPSANRAPSACRDSPKITFRDVAGDGRRGAAGDQGVPREPEEVPGARGAHPQGVLLYAGRPAPARRCSRAPSRVRPACPSSRSRARTSSRCSSASAPRACVTCSSRPELPLHHLHGRDRRGRPPPRRRSRRWSRRARADAQPAARRDGRLRDEGQHHPHRGHQPPGHPRSGAAAPGRSTARSSSTARPQGRTKILEVHARQAARQGHRAPTRSPARPGFTGADLQNLVNEAALLAARQGKREIDHLQLEEGIMRVIAEPEKKTRVMSEKERRVTAYHEMGHALVAHYLDNTDPVHKISVISRGQALGYTISLPTEDKFLTTRAELSDTMAMTLGGRAAEEIVFSEVTTGASNDLEGHRHGQADGHALRHVGQARAARIRSRSRPALPGPRVQLRARLLRRDRTRDRRRDPPHRRGGTPDNARGARRPPRAPRDDLGDPAQARDDRARAVHRAARRQV